MLRHCSAGYRRREGANCGESPISPPVPHDASNALFREQANRVVDLEFTLANVGGEKTTLTEDLPRYRRSLEIIAHQMTSVHESQPQIPDRVVICPVAWTDDTPDE